MVREALDDVEVDKAIRKARGPRYSRRPRPSMATVSLIEESLGSSASSVYEPSPVLAPARPVEVVTVDDTGTVAENVTTLVIYERSVSNQSASDQVT